MPHEFFTCLCKAPIKGHRCNKEIAEDHKTKEKENETPGVEIWLWQNQEKDKPTQTRKHNAK
jgi:hypothetical protein